MESRFVLARRFAFEIHAQLAQTALEARGIPSTLNLSLIGTPSLLAGTGSVELMVREEDLKAALEVLAAAD